MLADEGMEAALMTPVETDELIERETGRTREVEASGCVQASQLRVHGHRRMTGGKTKYQIRLGSQCIGNALRSGKSNVLARIKEPDMHACQIYDGRKTRPCAAGSASVTAPCAGSISRRFTVLRGATSAIRSSTLPARDGMPRKIPPASTV